MHSYALTNPWLLLDKYCLQQQGPVKSHMALGPVQPRSQGSRQEARERNPGLNEVGSAFFKSIRIPRENRLLSIWLVFIAECQIYDLSYRLCYPNSSIEQVILEKMQQKELTQSKTPPTAITDSIILSEGTWSINDSFKTFCSNWIEVIHVLVYRDHYSHQAFYFAGIQSRS